MNFKNALTQVEKFSSLAVAKDYAARKGFIVLLGDEGQFWVVSSNRAASFLINRGYSEAAR